MSTLLLTILRIGFLVLLWIFVIAVVLLVRRDVYGPRIGQRRRVDADKSASAHTPTPAPAPAPAQPARPTHQQRPPSLVVTDGPLAGTTIPLGRSDVVVGRSPDSALVLDDTYSSSRHARFFQSEGAWWVEDLNSTNGTYVSGQRISSPVMLQAGMPIIIGRTTMELRP